MPSVFVVCLFLIWTIADVTTQETNIFNNKRDDHVNYQRNEQPAQRKVRGFFVSSKSSESSDSSDSDQMRGGYGGRGRMNNYQHGYNQNGNRYPVQGYKYVNTGRTYNYGHDYNQNGYPVQGNGHGVNGRSDNIQGHVGRQTGEDSRESLTSSDSNEQLNQRKMRGFFSSSSKSDSSDVSGYSDSSSNGRMQGNNVGYGGRGRNNGYEHDSNQNDNRYPVQGYNTYDSKRKPHEAYPFARDNFARGGKAETHLSSTSASSDSPKSSTDSPESSDSPKSSQSKESDSTDSPGSSDSPNSQSKESDSTDSPESYQSKESDSTDSPGSSDSPNSQSKESDSTDSPGSSESYQSEESHSTDSPKSKDSDVTEFSKPTELDSITLSPQGDTDNITVGNEQSVRSPTSPRRSRCHLPSAFLGVWESPWPLIRHVEVEEGGMKLVYDLTQGPLILLDMKCTESRRNHYLFTGQAYGYTLSWCLDILPYRSGFKVNILNRGDMGPFQCCDAHRTMASSCSYPQGPADILHRPNKPKPRPQAVELPPKM